jgi:hypothetical protein
VRLGAFARLDETLAESRLARDDEVRGNIGQLLLERAIRGVLPRGGQRRPQLSCGSSQCHCEAAACCETALGTCEIRARENAPNLPLLWAWISLLQTLRRPEFRGTARVSRR